MQEISTDQIDLFIRDVSDLLIKFGPNFIFALLTLFIGYLLIGRISSLIKRMANKRYLEPTLTSFLVSLISGSLKVLLLVSVVSMLGVETSSIVALIAAAGFAVGLALQGSLSNFAGGVLIIMFKPYKIGDYIETQGFSGTVKSIQIFNTILTTPDNKTIIIPNGAISNSSITNFSTQANRRVDLMFGISYDDDFELAKKIILDLVLKDERIFNEPAPLVRVKELGSSSVNLTVRLWVHKTNYWPVYFDMTERVKISFDNNNLSFPYPQTDVHLFNKENK